MHSQPRLARIKHTDEHPHNLKRFVDAQNPVYDRVCVELRAGQKTSHWIWFIFPQLRGLGRSRMANEYGISSREEAVAYLQHPMLGERLSYYGQALLFYVAAASAVVIGASAVLGLCAGCVLMIRETQLAVKSLEEEAKTQVALHHPPESRRW